MRSRSAALARGELCPEGVVAGGVGGELLVEAAPLGVGVDVLEEVLGRFAGLLGRVLGAGQHRVQPRELGREVLVEDVRNRSSLEAKCA